MEISILAYLFLSVLAILTPLKKHLSQKMVLYFAGASVLVLLAVLRDFSVGPDTQHYLGQTGFLEIMRLPWKLLPFYKWEFGYTLLNKIVGTIYCNKRFLLVVVGLFTLVPLMVQIFKESLWGTLSLVCFLGMGIWAQSVYLMRQGCAISILSVSYRFCRERKFLPFLICVIAAMLFHRTAGIWLLLYFIYPIKIRQKTLAVCALGAVGCGVCGEFILFVCNFFARYKEEASYNGGIPMLLTLWLCVVAVFILNKGNIPERDRLYYWMLLLAASLQPIAFTFSNFSRIVLYFRIALVILLPNTLQNFLEGDKNCRKQAAAGALLCVTIFLWYIANGVPEYSFAL